jgi:glycerol-3-phosphate dehydrogenase (NAD(P)+)
MRVSLLGTGAYGIALALMFHKNHQSVKMWTKFEDEKKLLTEKREHTDKLPGAKIPEDIEISTDFEYVVKNADIIVIAVPAGFVNDVSYELSKYYQEDQFVLLASKGIERNSCSFVADIFRRHVLTRRYAVISGPSFAVDIVTNCPIGLTLASGNKKTRTAIKEALDGDSIKIRESRDVIGVEICGSIKNCIAIAAGMLDGMGYPESTQAMFIVESLNDMTELISKLGGDRRTILTYAGFGDLLLTATSKKSRNYSYGRLLGSKASKEEIDNYVKNTTIEGLYTIQSIYKLLKNKRVRIPIINLIYDIVEGKKDVDCLPEFLLNKK